MTDIFVPLTYNFALQIPESLFVLLMWMAWFVLILWIGLRSKNKRAEKSKTKLFWLIGLFILVLLFTPFFGFMPDGFQANPTANRPVQHLMLFANLPWMLASGMLGILPAIILAGLSGFLLALLDTHNIFTPLLFMTAGVFFNLLLYQHDDRLVNKVLRFPLFAAIGSFLGTLPLVFIAKILSGSGQFSTRLAIALSELSGMIGVWGGMLVFAGLICSIIAMIVHKHWKTKRPASPAKFSAQIRFIALTFIFLLFLITVSLYVQWSVLENSTRRSFVSQVVQVSENLKDAWAAFITSGENHLTAISLDHRLIFGSPEDIMPLFREEEIKSPYIDRLLLVNANQEVLMADTGGNIGDFIFSSQTVEAINMMFTGHPDILISERYGPNGSFSRLIFMTGINNANGQVDRLLMGMTDLDENPMTHMMLANLQQLTDQGGEGAIVSRYGDILYHTDQTRIGESYPLPAHQTPFFSESYSDSGLSALQYYQPIMQQSGAVVVSVPNHVIYQTALENALPGFLTSTGILIFVFLVGLLGVIPMIKRSDGLIEGFEKLTNGQLDGSLRLPKGLFEPSRLTKAFHRMAGALQQRNNQQTNLLSVSEGVNHQLDLSSVIDNILRAALSQGVSSARVILLDDEVLNSAEQEGPRQFGAGKHAEKLAPLDNSIIEKPHGRDLLILPDFKAGKSLPITRGMPYPAALVSVPLRYQNKFLGVLWVAFQDIRSPDDKTKDYFKELGHRAGPAIVIANQYEATLVRQKHLESLFDHLPDAVILMNPQGEVLYLNQTAKTEMSGKLDEIKRKLMTEIGVNGRGLGENPNQTSGVETINLSDGRVFVLNTRLVPIDGDGISVAIILRDITEQEKLKSLKSELVTTVSHELRSPLTLILGYGKILRLTGNLNEQQDNYISKIIHSVEEMRALVGNLLDLSRLDGGEPLEIKQFTVDQLTAKVVESMDAQAKQRGIRVNVSQPDYPLTIEGDFLFLTQALKNLVENAIKFSKMGEMVALIVREQDSMVEFAVRDHGIGIAPLDQRQLFKKFNKIDAAPTQTESGSGLGLAIVKSVTERHGGQVRVESQLGKGSTFYLQVPKKYAH